MKKYVAIVTCLALVALLPGQAAVAQDKKEKTNNDEIIIKRKDGKDAKVIIEIKGDAVTINGKPVDEFEDDNVSVRKRKTVTVATARSPFRGQGGTYNLSSDALLFGNANENIAFLGVVTEKTSKGAKIESITKESAAEKAGLKEGDVIMKIDETTIEDPDDLTKAIRKHKPDEKVTVVYDRDGKENKAAVTLGKRKGVAGFGYTTPNFESFPKMDLNWNEGQLGHVFSYAGRARLGIKAQDTEDGKGVKVLEIDDESAAAKAGLKENDIITEFDGNKVNSADELAKAAREAREKISFTVNYTRDGKAQTAEIKIPRKLKTTNL